MSGLTRLLARWRGQKIALVGIGNPDRGDDGAGVRLAEAIAARLGRAAPLVRVLQAGTAPEHVLPALCSGDLDHVVFLDAVDFGGTPGEVALAGSSAMEAQHPQLSTHRLSLGLLARIIEDRGRTRAWLLGIQPGAVRPGEGLGPAVRTTVEALGEVIASGLLAVDRPAAAAGAEGGPP
jgi:hydrogenase maturation protease